jgi:hypothetical protein
MVLQNFISVSDYNHRTVLLNKVDLCPMKSAATIFLLVLMVSIQTPMGQFFKLPLLIEHFIKHQKQDSVSFFAFLADHYATDHNDADLPADEQLPFKNITFYSIGNAIVAPVTQTTFFAPLPADMKVIFTDSYTPQQHLSSIFHPPRV